MCAIESLNLAALLPDDVVSVVASPRHECMPLLDEEADYVASRNMHPRREDEFRAGRACAHEAMAGFGFDRWPLLPAPTREPQWPQGIVGSITHCRGYCAAAVASESCCTGIGIDATAIESVGVVVAPIICSDEDLERLRRCAPAGRRLMLAMIFSAKESVFKAVFPSTRITFDFEHVAIRSDPDGSFHARASNRLLAQVIGDIDGRFEVRGSTLITAVVFHRPGG
jgi:4'-phosphopantetheinyl transferase EntD